MANILVIDDDSAVLNTIAQVLVEGGHRVTSAKDGSRGLISFRNEPPDLVITDIIMPEQEGIETIAQMRGERPDAKIIAVSAGGRIMNTDILRLARHMGAMDSITKPFDPDDLLSCVDRCLGAH